MAHHKQRGNRAVFYLRDSTGQHDQTAQQYVEWAKAKAEVESLLFNGTPQIINQMISTGESELGDIYLDYNVSGNTLTRPGLSALLQRIEHDQEISVLFIPRRDRLSRPDDPTQGVELENALRRSGITIQYQDKTLPPLSTGQRAEIGEQIMSLIEFDQSGKFRRDHASKMVYAKNNLAQQGLSTGGRPPFFLDRWLIDSHGNPVRKLEKGEIVRMAGHHVAWLRGSEEKIALAIRIVEMTEKMPVSRVARQLTEEGIPTPNSGEKRTDHGHKHHVSGAWNSNTINSILRSMSLHGELVYGRRSMGDQQRFTSQGPRDLTDDDYRKQDGKNVPKVIENPLNECIVAPAKFEPLISRERGEKLIELLDVRGQKQRGKPRATDPDQNPLGVRVYDWDCGWPMYRESYTLKKTKTYRYKCGAYTQSHGAMCAHNHIPGPQAAEFALNAIRQRLFSPALQEKLAKRLTELAQQNTSQHSWQLKIQTAEKEIQGLQQEIDLVSRNMSRAKTDLQFEQIAAEFDRLREEQKSRTSELEKLKAQNKHQRIQPDQDVKAALSLLDRLVENSSEKNPSGRLMRELFDLTNTRMFLKFESDTWGKRTVRRLSHGTITFGNTAAPIQVYQGKTGRHALKEGLAHKNKRKTTQSAHVGRSADQVVDEEGASLGNVNRDDKI